MPLEYDLFISYQWNIQEKVKKLYDFLLSKSFKVWMDIHQMDPSGPGLNEEIAKAIKSSKAVICCITKEYEESKNCKLEINWANEIDKPLIVLMFEEIKMKDLNAVGFIIASRLRINLYEDEHVLENWQGKYADKVLNSIGNALKRSSLHTNSASSEINASDGHNSLSIKQKIQIFEQNNNQSNKREIKKHQDSIQKNAVKQVEDTQKNTPNVLQQKPTEIKINKNHLFAACGDEIKIYDTATFDCVQVLRGHLDIVKCLELIGERFLASGGDDNTIKIWDLKQLNCIHTFTGHSDTVWGLKSISNELLASCSWDKRIKIWSLDKKECLATLEGHSGWVYCLEVLNENLLASGGYDEAIKIWDLRKFECIKNLKEHSYIVSCLKVLRERNILASASRDETIKLWDLSSFICLATLQGHNGGIYCLRQLNGEFLASGSDDRTIKIWDLKSYKCVRTIDAHNGLIRSIVVIDGNRFASCHTGDDFTITIWNMDNFKCVMTINNQKAVWSLLFK